MRTAGHRLSRLTASVRAALASRGAWGAVVAAPGLVLAGPSGEQIVSGTVTVERPDAATTHVAQGSHKAIIDWQSFSIAGHEYVRFFQPGTTAVALNRVVGGSPSEIFGHLSANGRIFLINPRGVAFAPGAEVDVGALLASVLDIHDEDFLAGRYVFVRDPGAPDGAGVVNAGVINAAEGGFVVLAGDHASNSGVIAAQLGTVVLASGSRMTLGVDDGGLVSFAVDEAAVSNLAGVDNLGEITADGGRVLMTARVAEDLVATAVNNAGLVRAHSIEARDGAIFLRAAGGDIEHSGVLDASAEDGQRGGRVIVTGDRDINVAPGSEIRADGDGAGGGGAVRLVAERDLNFREEAVVSVEGGEASTRGGGFVELSGHRDIRIRGTTRLGAGGRLLIDPLRLEIASFSASGGYGGPSSGTNQVDRDFIQNQLNADVDVLLFARDTITVGTGGGSGITATSGSGDLALAIGSASFVGSYGGSLGFLGGSLNCSGGACGPGSQYVFNPDGNGNIDLGSFDIDINGNVSIQAGVNFGGLEIRNVTSHFGDVTLTGASSAGAVRPGNITAAGAVRISAPGGFITANDISGASVDIDGGAGMIGAAVTATAGPLSIDVQSSLALDAVTGESVSLTAGTGLGLVSLTATAGNAVIDGGEGIFIGGHVEAMGSVDLLAGGSLSGGIEITGHVVAQTGNVTLAANVDDVMVGSSISAGGFVNINSDGGSVFAGDISGQGNVSVTGQSLSIGNVVAASSLLTLAATSDLSFGSATLTNPVGTATINISANGALTVGGPILGSAMNTVIINITNNGAANTFDFPITAVSQDNDARIAVFSSPGLTLNSNVVADAGGVESQATVDLFAQSGLFINGDVTLSADSDAILSMYASEMTITGHLEANAGTERIVAAAVESFGDPFIMTQGAGLLEADEVQLTCDGAEGGCFALTVATSAPTITASADGPAPTLVYIDNRAFTNPATVQFTSLDPGEAPDVTLDFGGPLSLSGGIEAHTLLVNVANGDLNLLFGSFTIYDHANLVADGDVVLDQLLLTAASLTVAADADGNDAGNVLFQAATSPAVVTVSGSIAVSGVNFNVLGGVSAAATFGAGSDIDIDLTGSMSVAGGSESVASGSADASARVHAGNNLTIQAAGGLTVAGGSAFARLSSEVGTAFAVAAADASVSADNDVSITVSGDLTISGGRVSATASFGSGTATASARAVVDGTNVTLNVGGSLNVLGGSSASAEAEASSGSNAGAAIATATLVAAGAMDLTVAQDMTVRGGNHGSAQASGGTPSASNTATADASARVEAGTSLSLTVAAGSLTVAGGSGGSATASGAGHNTALVDVSASLRALGGDLALTVAGGVNVAGGNNVSASASFATPAAVNDATVIATATLAAAGALDLAVAQDMTVRGGNNGSVSASGGGSPSGSNTATADASARVEAGTSLSLTIAAGSLTVAGGSGGSAEASYTGRNTAVLDANASVRALGGNLDLTVAGGVNVTGGNNVSASASFGTSAAVNDATANAHAVIEAAGTLTLNAAGGLTVAGGSNAAASASDSGHNTATANAYAAITGATVDLSVTGGLTVQGGAFASADASSGSSMASITAVATVFAKIAATGDLTLNVNGGNLDVLGGRSAEASGSEGSGQLHASVNAAAQLLAGQNLFVTVSGGEMNLRGGSSASASGSGSSTLAQIVALAVADAEVSAGNDLTIDVGGGSLTVQGGLFADASADGVGTVSAEAQAGAYLMAGNNLTVVAGTLGVAGGSFASASASDGNAGTRAASVRVTAGLEAGNVLNLDLGTGGLGIRGGDSNSAKATFNGVNTATVEAGAYATGATVTVAVAGGGVVIDGGEGGAQAGFGESPGAMNTALADAGAVLGATGAMTVHVTAGDLNILGGTDTQAVAVGSSGAHHAAATAGARLSAGANLTVTLDAGSLNIQGGTAAVAAVNFGIGTHSAAAGVDAEISVGGVLDVTAANGIHVDGGSALVSGSGAGVLAFASVRGAITVTQDAALAASAGSIAIRGGGGSNFADPGAATFDAGAYVIASGAVAVSGVDLLIAGGSSAVASVHAGSDIDIDLSGSMDVRGGNEFVDSGSGDASARVIAGNNLIIHTAGGLTVAGGSAGASLSGDAGTPLAVAAADATLSANNDVDLTVDGDLTITGGQAMASAQAGSAAAMARGAISGNNLSLNVGGALYVLGGASASAGAAGPGSNFAAANASAALTAGNAANVNVGAGISVRGGISGSALASGGTVEGENSAAVDVGARVEAGSVLNVTAGVLDVAGGSFASAGASGGGRNTAAVDADARLVAVGAMDLTIAGGVQVAAGNHGSAHASFGSAAAFNDAAVNANAGVDAGGMLTLNVAAGGLMVAGGNGLDAFASATGHNAAAGHADGAVTASAIDITAAGGITIQGGSDASASAAFGPSGAFGSAAVQASARITGTGDVTVNATSGDLNVSGGAAAQARASDGSGDMQAAVDAAAELAAGAALTVTLGAGGLNMQAGGAGAFAPLGGTANGSALASADAVISVGGLFNLTAANAIGLNGGSAFAAGTGAGNVAFASAKVAVAATGDANLNATAGPIAMAGGLGSASGDAGAFDVGAYVSANVLSLVTGGDVTNGPVHIDAGALEVAAGGNIDLTSASITVGNQTIAGYGDPVVFQLMQSPEVGIPVPPAPDPNAVFLAHDITINALTLNGSYPYIVFSLDGALTLGSVSAPFASDLLVQIAADTPTFSIGVEDLPAMLRDLNFDNAGDIAVFPGTTIAFGAGNLLGLAQQGDLFFGENGDLDVGAKNILCITLGACNGLLDNVITTGIVAQLQPVIEPPPEEPPPEEPPEEEEDEEIIFNDPLPEDWSSEDDDDDDDEELLGEPDGGEQKSRRGSVTQSGGTAGQCPT
jgi:filamentous hemagglutinin family protein